MAFPDDPLGVRVELLLDGGAVDITGDVLTSSPLTITRGRRDEGARVDAGSCTLLLRNPGGRYSPRNPLSDLYGRIGRNTPVRVSVQPGGPGTPRLVRFVGEAVAWPPSWSTQYDVTVSLQLAGILRRLGQGAPALKSAMAREFANPARRDIAAYWPLEDGPTATQFASALPGGPPMRISTPGVTAAGYSGYAASGPVPLLGTGALTAAMPRYTTTGQIAARAVVHFPSQLPDAPVTVFGLMGTGSAAQWFVRYLPTGGIQLVARASGSTELLASDPLFPAGGLPGQTVTLGIDLTGTSAPMAWRFYLIREADIDLYNLTPTWERSGILASRTPGRITHVTVGRGGEDAGDTAVGHVAVATSTDAYALTLGAMIGWAGEGATNRLSRLAREEAVPLVVNGRTGATPTALGGQTADTLLALAQTAADADGGILYEQREAVGLAYRSRASLYTQAPRLALTYGRDVAAPFEPADDDQALTNDVTVSRTGGTSARAVRESGPLSVLPPPAGVGRYASDQTLNLARDEQCQPWAEWTVHRATWDAPRYPAVAVAVHEVPHLAATVAAVDVGDRATVDGAPLWTAPGRVELLVEGYAETLGDRTWDVEFMCSPGGPWQVATVDDPDTRAAAEGSSLLLAVSEAAPALTVAGPPWSETDTPVRLALGAEEVTATAIRGPADVFARTVAGGWGTATTGQAWTVAGGAASSYSVASGAGRIAMAVTGTHRTQLGNLLAADPEVIATLTPNPAALTGAAYTVGPLLRQITTGTYYHVRLIHFADNRIGLWASAVTPATGQYDIPGASAYVGTHAPGRAWRIRARLTGSRIQARMWPAGTREPSVWHIDGTDTAITGAGSIGVRAYYSAGATGPTVGVSDFQVITPQVFTVERGAGGLALPHPAGTAVQLARLPYAAL
ncbi:hypothetical protein [Streptomyces sp. NPDC047046]|uniref:hypothetical protein n=1 Tax=Streptomyces sp. NPDC047046 TaxID=3155378 RepID=UPI0034051E17